MPQKWKANESHKILYANLAYNVDSIRISIIAY